MAIDRNRLKKEVGEKLSSLREQSGLTQEQVVKGIGNIITSTTLSLYERGERLVTLDVLLALSDFYSVPLEAICGSSNHDTPVTAGSFLRMIVNLCETGKTTPRIQTEERPYDDDEVFTAPDEEGLFMEYDEEYQSNESGYKPTVTVTTITIKVDAIGRFLHDYTKMLEGDILNKPAFLPALEAWKKEELRKADQIPL